MEQELFYAVQNGDVFDRSVGYTDKNQAISLAAQMMSNEFFDGEEIRVVVYAGDQIQETIILRPGYRGK